MKLPEKIRFSVPILSLAKRLDLDPEGDVCVCPFHEGEERTMRLIATENRFQCDVCSANGFQIELVEKVREIGREKAMKWLASEYKIEEDVDQAERIRMKWMKERQKVSLDDVFGAGTSDRFGAGKSGVDTRVYEAIVEGSRLVEPAKSFLELRGYTDEVVKKQGLAWIGEPASLFGKLKKEFGDSAVENAGLLDRGQRFLLNEHRLIYPFRSGGKVNFVTGRRIDGRRPVFLSPKRKRMPIYNIDIVDDLNEGDRIYIAPDMNGCFALLLKGYPSVAVLGVPERDDESLKKLSAFDIVACGENDERGKEFNRMLLGLFAELGRDIHIQLVPEKFSAWSDYVVFKKKL